MTEVEHRGLVGRRRAGEKQSQVRKSWEDVF